MEFTHSSSTSRVNRVIESVLNAIRSGTYPPGSRLPSIRKQAALAQVSPFTVAEAYDRLVAQGYLASRRGCGFFVSAHMTPAQRPPAILDALPLDEHWLLHDVYHQPNHRIPSGSG